MNELAKKNIECLAEKMKDIEEGIVNYVNKMVIRIRQYILTDQPMKS